MNAYWRLATGEVVAVLDGDLAFPPPQAALAQPNGLLAIGGDLRPERLLVAYRNGIFPWFGPDEPILWWCPDPRMVLFPEELKISRSLATTLRQGRFSVRFDSAFRQVMEACSQAPRKGQPGTWIVPQMMEAYCHLHQLGVAHSVECWRNGQLVGGLYGVALGRVFYGESMFHSETDASKVALVHLVRFLRANGYGMIDCQMHTPHLASLGAREIGREAFARRLSQLLGQGDVAWDCAGLSHDAA